MVFITFTFIRIFFQRNKWINDQFTNGNGTAENRVNKLGIIRKRVKEEVDSELMEEIKEGSDEYKFDHSLDEVSAWEIKTSEFITFKEDSSDVPQTKKEKISTSAASSEGLPKRLPGLVAYEDGSDSD